MTNLNTLIINFSICLALLLSLLNTISAAELPHKKQVVVAMPFRPNMPFDPNWYTPEYVQYIANLLPADRYQITGYFVSLENIPKFIQDMEALHAKNKNLCILNFCDGGEWDGYPGISVTENWEKSSLNGLVPFSGANTEFIYNSDDKMRMQSHIAKAKLKSPPQALLQAKKIGKLDLEKLVVKNKLNQSWPLFCKLNIGAGALGISRSSICNNVSELEAQLQKIHEMFPKSDILVQPYLKGPEYTVLVMKDRVYAGVRRDFHNPYNLMEEDYLHDPNHIGEEITYYAAPNDVQELALKAIQAIPGKHHYTRVDLRGDGKGNVFVIDINDRPGFGNPSTVKCMLDFFHLPESQFLQDIIETID